MKTLFFKTVLICFIFITLVGYVSAEDKNNIPITTKSAAARALYNEGMELFDNGQFSGAIEKFDQAIAEDTNLGMAYAMSAAVCHLDINYTKRDELLAKAAKTTNLSKAETLVIQYYQAFFSRETAKQKEIIDKLTVLLPENTTAQHLTGIYLRRSGQNDKSIKVLKAVVEQHPTYLSFIDLGYSYYNTQNYDEALKNYNKAVDMAPDTPNAFNGLGYTFMAMNQLDKAIDAFNKALKQNPNFLWALSGQGDAYLLMDKPEQARKNYQKMLESAKNNHQRNGAHQQMAAYYVYQNQLDRVSDEWKQATDLFETDEDVQTRWEMYRRRGHVCRQLGNFDDAKRINNKWIDLVKKSEKSEDYKNGQMSAYYSVMVDIAIKQNDLQHAKNLEQKFLKLDLENITEKKSYSYIKANLAAAEGRYDDAIATLQKLPPETDAAYLTLARVYRDKGDTEKAKAYYQKVLDYGHEYLFWRLLNKKQAREELAEL